MSAGSSIYPKLCSFVVLYTMCCPFPCVWMMRCQIKRACPPVSRHQYSKSDWLP
ncbi:hypothetical protein BDZ91DRAFT_730810 [Kalaharituber pfeilii]|nr:hypothetical protein BDZ91DRAFT_730810 [Kalaharituber pfeilii]